MSNPARKKKKHNKNSKTVIKQKTINFICIV